MSGRTDSEPGLSPFRSPATMPPGTPSAPSRPTPWCAVILLVVGFAGLVLHVVGVGFHAWFQASVQLQQVSFGLWQAASCVQDGTCTTRVLGFGVTGAFEATRVFACATIVAGVIAWFFTLALMKRPNRVWCIRACILWLLTTLFGLVTVVLFPVYMADVAAFTLPHVAPSGHLTRRRLGWAYWMAVLADVLFFLVLLGCWMFGWRGLLPAEDERQLLHRTSPGRDSGFGMQGKVVLPNKHVNKHNQPIETLNRTNGAVLGRGDRGPAHMTSAPTEPRVQLNSTSVSVQHTGPASTTSTHVAGTTSLTRPVQHLNNRPPVSGGGVRVHVGSASTLSSHPYTGTHQDAYMNTYPGGHASHPAPSSGSLYSATHGSVLPDPTYAHIVRPVAMQSDPDPPTITMLVSNPRNTPSPSLPLTYISTGNA